MQIYNDASPRTLYRLLLRKQANRMPTKFNRTLTATLEDGEVFYAENVNEYLPSVNLDLNILTSRKWKFSLFTEKDFYWQINANKMVQNEPLADRLRRHTEQYEANQQRRKRLIKEQLKDDVKAACESALIKQF